MISLACELEEWVHGAAGLGRMGEVCMKSRGLVAVRYRMLKGTAVTAWEKR